MRISLLFIFVLAVLPTITYAQQTSDPVVSTYQQLLSEANDRVARASSQIQTLSTQLQTTQAELAKLKVEVTPKDPTAKK